MIVIKHKGGNFVVPVLPVTVGYGGNDGIYDDVRVLQRGTVPFFDGTELKTFSWSSFFPKNSASYTEVNKVMPPIECTKLMESLKDTGEVITLIVADLDIEIPAQIRSFYPHVERVGDIEYSVNIVEYREIIVTKKQAAAAKSNNTRKPKDATPPATSAKTYTVKKGDSLSAIAKQMGIKSWRLLYEKNKKVVGNNPNLIYPGQVLQL